MIKFGLYIAKIKGKLRKSHEPVHDYYRRRGVKIGKNCLICSSPMTKESFLIEFGDNVTVSTNVTFITHDNSVKLLFPDKSDCFGRIKIGNNCFVGENATILYGVTLNDKIIVAAGSVVTKSFMQSNIIIGGNPAKVISSWDIFKKKLAGKVISRSELIRQLSKDDTFLVRR